MEIKNDKKTVVTGKTICLVAGILSGICGFYWLVKALFFDGHDIASMLSCFAIALFLIPYGSKR